MAGKDAYPALHINHLRVSVARASLPAHYCHGLRAEAEGNPASEYLFANWNPGNKLLGCFQAVRFPDTRPARPAENVKT